MCRNAPLEKIVHECNVWIRGCTHNAICNFQSGFGYDFYGDDEDEYLSEPPLRFLEAAPAAARAAMRTALATHRPLMQELLTASERSTLVTAEHKAAEEAFRHAGRGGWADFFEGCGSFSPTNRVCSWVVWALDELEKALYRVAWQGMPLSHTVPKSLQPWEENDWKISKYTLERIPFSQWLDEHEEWFGRPVIGLFHRARAEVVAATLRPLDLPISESPSKRAVREIGGVQTRRRARLQARQRFADLRDHVFGLHELVELITGYC